MFVLAKERLVWWPVTVPLAIDGGEIQEHHFEARFRLLSFEESKGPATDLGLLQRVVVDWRGVSREDGSVVPFSPEALAEMIERGPDSVKVRAAMVAAYGEALVGARAKNSPRPRAAGRAAEPQTTA